MRNAAEAAFAPDRQALVSQKLFLRSDKRRHRWEKLAAARGRPSPAEVIYEPLWGPQNYASAAEYPSP